MLRQTIIIFSTIVLATMIIASTAAMVTVVTPDATLSRPLQDPWIPPATRAKATIASTPIVTRGEALTTQIEAKLKADFDRADIAKTGMLTRKQANAAGFGFVVNNFDGIDRYKTGFVRFDDLQQFLLTLGPTVNTPATAPLRH